MKRATLPARSGPVIALASYAVVGAAELMTAFQHAPVAWLRFLAPIPLLSVASLLGLHCARAEPGAPLRTAVLAAAAAWLGVTVLGLLKHLAGGDTALHAGTLAAFNLVVGALFFVALVALAARGHSVGIARRERPRRVVPEAGA